MKKNGAWRGPKNSGAALLEVEGERLAGKKKLLGEELCRRMEVGMEWKEREVDERRGLLLAKIFFYGNRESRF